MIDLSADRFVAALRAGSTDPARAGAEDGVHVMATLTGTPGDDTLKGGGGPDIFHLEAGGDDKAKGGGGGDTFYMGASFTADDQIDGSGNPGSGQKDSIILDGDYSGGVVLGDRTLVDVESMVFVAGHDYDITLNAAPVPNFQFTVDGQSLHSDDQITLDASLVTSATVWIRGGAGADKLIGGLSNMIWTGGGIDTVIGGAFTDHVFADGADASVATGGGGDVIEILGAPGAEMTINGGTGEDSLEFSGLQGVDTYLMTADHVSNIETFLLTGGRLALGDGLAQAGDSLDINASDARQLVYVDASLEDHDGYTLTGSDFEDTLIGGGGADVIDGGKGSNTLFGGAGDDQITGGDAHDKLVGGAGADLLVGNGGPDNFVFLSAGDSTAAAADEIADLFNVDFIELKAIDANDKKAGNQAFHLVDDFTGHRGELMLSYDHDLDRTMVLGDIDGDGEADLAIAVDGKHLGFTNFVL
jgi:Ca2+-binding RTX toxin-like protein